MLNRLPLTAFGVLNLFRQINYNPGVIRPLKLRTLVNIGVPLNEAPTLDESAHPPVGF
jgi:hypothetical protein